MKKTTLLIIAMLYLAFSSHASAEDSVAVPEASVKLALKGKYEEALKFLDKKGPDDARVFAALCLLGMGKDKEAREIANAFENDHHKSNSPALSTARSLRAKFLQVGSEEYKSALEGDSLVSLRLKGTIIPKSRLLVENNGIYINAKAESEIILHTGKHKFYYIPEIKSRPGFALLNMPDDEIFLGEATIKPWTRSQVVELSVPDIESIEIITPSEKEDVPAKTATFKIAAPKNFKYEVAVYKSEGNLEIWTLKKEGSSIVAFDSDGRAIQPLEVNENYILRIWWKGDKPDMRMFVCREFKTK